MGATRVILPGNAPIGCYPFVLTELASANPADYDNMGCLRSVNDLIILKNNDLQQAIEGLRREFPNTFIFYADFYNSELSLIRQTLYSGKSWWPEIGKPKPPCPGFCSRTQVVEGGGSGVGWEVLVLASTTSTQSQNTRCPFDLLYHLGDGVFDNGNAIANMQHGSRLPAANIPYGNTHPGKPTGRWSDGLLDIDYGAQGLGFPEITAYLSDNSSSANAIMFAVARSPVLDRSFFTTRGIRIPSYTVSLSIQMSWFKKYLNTICSTPTDRAKKLSKALVLFGDVEANDITYPLIQRKSIRHVQSYIPYVTKAQINAARARTQKLAYKHVVELEENITTTPKGSVDLQECQFALIQINTFFGMEYTLHKRLTIVSQQLFNKRPLLHLTAPHRNHHNMEFMSEHRIRRL
ncbi:hypothetical protein RD792_004365 [Penstemon davidsonii]|uniref:GDSL esterase/lipase n=1 Tax=Penstemon davidsonii TaxID=160366 RepID=A0ABR0DH98_9LAMI|nr:hypothetical protein RD792_004365 [Penstemon davidsonii]